MIVLVMRSGPGEDRNLSDAIAALYSDCENEQHKREVLFFKVIRNITNTIQIYQRSRRSLRSQFVKCLIKLMFRKSNTISSGARKNVNMSPYLRYGSVEIQG